MVILKHKYIHTYSTIVRQREKKKQMQIRRVPACLPAFLLFVCLHSTLLLVYLHKHKNISKYLYISIYMCMHGWMDGWVGWDDMDVGVHACMYM